MAESEAKRTSVLTWIIRGVLAFGLSAGALWWALHDVDMTHVGARLGESQWSIWAIFFGVQLVLHLVRVVRWGLLVKPLGNPSNRAIFAATTVGFPATFFLPFRLGEFVRPAMIARAGVPFGAAMASVVVERIADGLFNLGLFFLLLRLLPDNALSGELATFSNLALILFGGGLVVLVLCVLFEATAAKITRATIGRFLPALADKLLDLLTRFVQGLRVLRSPGRLFGFIALTGIFWFSNGAVTWLLIESYNPGITFWSGPFTISVVVFAIMIPAGPGFAGVLEAGFRVGLAPFGVNSDEAAVGGLALHALQLVQMALLGGIGLAAADPSQRVSVREAAPPEALAPTAPDDRPEA